MMKNKIYIMNNRTKNLFEKYGKSIYISKIRNRWAIVIMPDEIRIDNYYKETHLHPEQRGIHILQNTLNWKLLD